MLRLLGIAGLALALGACVYTPTPGPSVTPAAGGYTLNDNGYQAYYDSKVYDAADCKNQMSAHCEDRLEYDDEFCARWHESGRCGDSADTNVVSREISPTPPGGRDWFAF